MTAHEVYAIIHDGIVRNVCVSGDYEQANWTDRCAYG